MTKLNIAEIRNNEDFWNATNKHDSEIQATATVKELTDAFGMLSDIQVELSNGIIEPSAAVERINHVKKHLLEAQDGIDPERELRRNTMFLSKNPFCSCVND